MVIYRYHDVAILFLEVFGWKAKWFSPIGPLLPAASCLPCKKVHNSVNLDREPDFISHGIYSPAGGPYFINFHNKETENLPALLGGCELMQGTNHILTISLSRWKRMRRSLWQTFLCDKDCLYLLRFILSTRFWVLKLNFYSTPPFPDMHNLFQQQWQESRVWSNQGGTQPRGLKFSNGLPPFPLKLWNITHPVGWACHLNMPLRLEK